MKTLSIREARNRFTEIARAAEAGERIVITRNGKPVAELGPPPKKKGLDLEAGRRWLAERGITQPVFNIAPDFDDPLPEDFLITPLPE